MANPTRYPSGVSTHKIGTPLANYPLPDPIQTGANVGTNVVTYVTDYTDTGSTVNYTITGTSSTFALEAGVGGFSVLTPGAATTASSMYRTSPSFQFQPGNDFWFVKRAVPGLFATTGTYSFGMQAGAATTDGLWFTKPASSTSVNLVSTIGGVATTLATGVTTHVSGTLAAGVTVLASTTITVTSTAGLLVGQYVYGTGIPLNSTVISVTSATAFVISAPATAAGTGLTLIYASALDVSFYYDGQDLFVYNVDVVFTRIVNATLTAALLSEFVSCTPTATDLIHSDYVLVAQEMSR
jgi:hypothetical protein